MEERAHAPTAALVAVALSVAFGVAGAAAIAVAGSAGAAPAPSPPHLDVLPFPGTPDASPQTEIDLLEVAPAQLKGIVVRGSSSGMHAGRIRAMRRGRGAAFLPDAPFAEGEHVTVEATLASRYAAVATGAPNPDRISFGFTVARPAPLAGLRTPGAAADGHAVAHEVHTARAAARDEHTARAPALVRSFKSEPAFHPPRVFVSGHAPKPSEGDFVLDAHNSIQSGPLIVNSAGQIVWYAPIGGPAAYNTQVQQYMGQPVITFWRGRVVPPGVGTGTDVVVDHSYRTVASVNAANGYNADLHEFQITPQGTALITAYAPVHANLSSVGGPRKGTLLDSIIQEIDISSGQLLWEWHAYGHVPISDSHAGKPGTTPYDFFHLDSIQQLSGGDLLISARHTSAVYEISHTTGQVVWALGGKHSSFRMGPGASFDSEHDARLLPDGTLTVFDDGDGPGGTPESQSRALRIRLNATTRRATLVSAYTNRPPLLASSQGSVQLQVDGDIIVGWGNAHYFTEFDGHGHERFVAHFGGPIQTYRAYRFPWTGQPADYLPALAVSPSARGAVAYASWNGATDIAFWQVLAGPTRNSMAVVAQRAWDGLETGIHTASRGPCFAVQAMDSSGRVLSTSAVSGC